jgi:O-antigen/teichoic acid export membrane protein
MNKRNRIQKFFIFLWESPTLMTWGSFLTRSLAAVVVLPLVLRNFTEAQTALWFIFAQVISLQLLVDMGFTPTFSRFIAINKSNLAEIENVRKIMKYTYLRMTLLSFFLLLSVGTYFVYNPIIRLGEYTIYGWIAWGMIVFTSLFYLRGNQYSAYLQGINQVAMLRRWEVLISLGGILSSMIVLILGGGVAGMVIASQTWVLLGILLNRWLAKNAKIESTSPPTDSQAQTNLATITFQTIWATAWRSGIGVLISFGTLRFASLYIAKEGNGVQVAVFLLGLRVIEMINEFAQAPLYSKLPRLSALYAKQEMGTFMGVAKQGMTRSHWIFVGGIVGAGMIGNFALQLIGSQTAFPEAQLWILLGFAYFFQRFGAMHLHLFSATNQIIWHIVNGITGAIFTLVFLISHQFLPIFSYAIALLTSSLLFYAWYCAYRSYQEFHLSFWKFEKEVSLLPFFALVIYAIFAFR